MLKFYEREAASRHGSSFRTRRDEAVSPQYALRTMTSTAARFSVDEKQRGSIETGKLGDFVVLSDDCLTVPPERAIRPDLTVVGGRVAFQRHD